MEDTKATVENENTLDVQETEQTVNPWKVEAPPDSSINYRKLIDKFGAHEIDGEMICRVERVTNMRAHHFLRRGLFFSNKDLGKLLDSYEAGKPIYLYTGRGPSSESMHLGHMVPFEFTRYLQEAFGAILVVQMSDDEKFYFKGNKPLEHFTNLGHENVKDIIAVGFDVNRTLIFDNSKEITENPALMRNFIDMSANTKGSTIKAAFGLSTDAGKGNNEGGNTVGQIVWPIFQSIPAYASSFPYLLSPDAFCLVVMAIDQAPYFRLARDFAGDTDKIKPAEVHSEFLPSLLGVNAKMSSTEAAPVIFLTDTPKQIKDKINKHAFSGGGETLEDHRLNGADLTRDIPYQYLLYFHPDDNSLERIAVEYSSGRMTTGEIKKILIQDLQKFVSDHQIAKAQVTEQVIFDFYNHNKEFDKSRPIREPLELYSPKQYARMGINFDRYSEEARRRDKESRITSSKIMVESETNETKKDASAIQIEN